MEEEQFGYRCQGGSTEKEHFGYKDVGYKFVTEWRYVTPTEVNLFCDITDTREDVFLRDDAAQEFGLKAAIVPALLIFAKLMSGLMEVGLTGEGLFIGINNAEFKVPVHPYDRIRGEIEVLEKRVTTKGDRVIVRYAWQVRNENDVIVAQGENRCMFPNPR